MSDTPKNQRMKNTAYEYGIVDLCKSGYWFCQACEHITEPLQHDDGRADTCATCGASRLKWCPPVPQPDAEPAGTVPKFLVQIECAHRTRWIYSPEEFSNLLANLTRRALALTTDGPQPAVTVTREQR